MNRREWVVVVLGLAGTFLMPWPNVASERAKPADIQAAPQIRSPIGGRALDHAPAMLAAHQPVR